MDRLVGRLVPGQEVRDINGRQVGSIGHIHRVSEVAGENGQAQEDTIEVTTGFLGLLRWYIPLSAISDTTDVVAFVKRPLAEFDELWRYKPGFRS